MAPKLGIGITTYNRAERLGTTLDSVVAMTRAPHVLLVADDGSSDDTLDQIRRRRVAHIAGPNRGIAWNKNRLLYYLTRVEGCDLVILLEDDTFPEKPGWERVWMEAASRHGHMNFAGGWMMPHVTGGQGTPEDPYRSPYTSGQCVSFSRKAILTAGYMDTRFKRYGYEHGEHTERMLRSGFGGDPATGEKFLLASDLCVTEGDALLYVHLLEENAPIYLQVRQDQTPFRNAWRGPEEMRTLQEEIRGATLYDLGMKQRRLLRATTLAMTWPERGRST